MQLQQLVDDFISYLAQPHNLKLRTGVISAGLSGIIACNVVGGGQGRTPPPPPTPTVTDMSVTSTDNAVRAFALLNPAVNGGIFTVSWTDASAIPFNANVYLSADQVFDVNDIQLFTVAAKPYSDSGGSGYTTTGNYRSCVYAANNTISCGTEVNIQSFLDVLPKSAYIIVRVCDLNASNCMTRSAPIRLE